MWECGLPLCVLSGWTKLSALIIVRKRTQTPFQFPPNEAWLYRLWQLLLSQRQLAILCWVFILEILAFSVNFNVFLVEIQACWLMLGVGCMSLPDARPSLLSCLLTPLILSWDSISVPPVFAQFPLNDCLVSKGSLTKNNRCSEMWFSFCHSLPTFVCTLHLHPPCVVRARLCCAQNNCQHSISLAPPI